MGLFDAFRKQTPEEQLRNTLSETFEKIVRDAKIDAGGDPIMGGILIEVAIGKMYNSLKQNSGIINLCTQQGLNYQRILDEEREKARRRHLR